jgi:hypothetical protein
LLRGTDPADGRSSGDIKKHVHVTAPAQGEGGHSPWMHEVQGAGVIWRGGGTGWRGGGGSSLPRGPRPCTII